MPPAIAIAIPICKKISEHLTYRAFSRALLIIVLASYHLGCAIPTVPVPDRVYYVRLRTRCEQCEQCEHDAWIGTFVEPSEKNAMPGEPFSLRS